MASFGTAIDAFALAFIGLVILAPVELWYVFWRISVFINQERK